MKGKLLGYFVYILKCKDDTLYAGITNDLEKRMAAHNSGKGAKHTCCRLPVALVYNEICGDKSSEFIRELEIKKMTGTRKCKLMGEI